MRSENNWDQHAQTAHRLSGPAGSWEHSYRETSSQWTLMSLSLSLWLHYCVSFWNDFWDLIINIWSVIYSITVCTNYAWKWHSCISCSYIYLNTCPFPALCIWHKSTEHSGIQRVLTLGHMMHIDKCRWSEVVTLKVVLLASRKRVKWLSLCLSQPDWCAEQRPLC